MWFLQKGFSEVIMKRKGLLKVLSGVVFCAAIFGFTACENFAQGVELQDALRRLLRKKLHLLLIFPLRMIQTREQSLLPPMFTKPIIK